MTSQLARMATEWPRTFAALISSYYPEASWGTTSPAGQNDCGYAIQGLANYERAAMALHGHKDLSHHALDMAAAKEVSYHWAKGTRFRRPCAALSACWLKLVTERPERLYAARAAANSPSSRYDRLASAVRQIGAEPCK